MDNATTKELTIIAIIAAFNEGDILPAVIRHLVQNGVSVYLIDNHSTDDTVERASEWFGKGLINIERFPDKRSHVGEGFVWGDLLRRKEELANELKADWFMHHDADEIREAPWPGCSLREAIGWVDQLGYNCIDFWVLNFQPVDNGFCPGIDPTEYFTYYKDAGWLDFCQRKCWRAGSKAVSLLDWGGHDVRFDGRRIFPIRFLLRHYPIRSQEHGIRKVFAERKARFLPHERARGWHQQYDHIRDKNYRFIADPAAFKIFDPYRVRLDLLLREESRWRASAMRLPTDQPVSLESEFVLRQVERLASSIYCQPNSNLELVRSRVARLKNYMSQIKEYVAAVYSAAGNPEGKSDELQHLWRYMWTDLCQSDRTPSGETSRDN